MRTSITLALTLLCAGPAFSQDISREDPITDASQLPIAQGVYVQPGQSCDPQSLAADDRYFAYDGASFHYHETSCDIVSFWGGENNIYFIDTECMSEGMAFIDTQRFVVASQTSFRDESYDQVQLDLCPGSLHSPR